jgi:hypothetical protein
VTGAIGEAKGVDINHASEDELKRVGGLGEERAKRLIQNRPFRSWDDLKRVERLRRHSRRRSQEGGSPARLAATAGSRTGVPRGACRTCIRGRRRLCPITFPPATLSFPAFCIK